jgi:L-asparagine transporter-like permease
MELEELKNTWKVLEEKLNKNEILNKQLVQEMLHKKSNRSLNRLINFDAFNLICWFLTIPASIWGYHLPRFENFLFPKILFATIVITSIPIAIWGCYQLIKLMKIDFSKSIRDSMHEVNQYAIMIGKEKIVTYLGLIPLYYILGILCYYETKANLLYWTFLVVALIIGITLVYWIYKRVYDTNIQAIKKSLEEMKEMEEE